MSRKGLLNRKKFEGKRTLFFSVTAFAFLISLFTFIRIVPQGEATDLPVSSYRDFSYNGPSVKAPTGQKPQSKLWFNDGIWWGSLFNKTTDNYEIYKLNSTTQQWTTTNTVIDYRNSSSADTLWDGNKLYVVSAARAQTGSSKNANVWRFSYNTSNETYTLDSGFPVVLDTNGGIETVVIAKDTNNTLWVAYAKNEKVYAIHSTTDDATWTTPYQINTTGSNNLTSDDIASIIAYGSNIGIMWSNQNDQKIYFATHVDGTSDTQWSSSVAVQGAAMVDDHINIKADSQGNVYAVTKTSRNDVSSDPSEPIILLSVLHAGNWTNYTVAEQGEGSVTRGILALDETHNTIYVLYTNNESGGYIVYKTSPLDAISFSQSSGSPFIQNSTDTHLNNATTSKQNIASQSGFVVMAGDDSTKYYDHNYLTVNGATPTPTATNTPTPTINPTSTPTITPTPTSSMSPTPTPTTTGSITIHGSAVTGTNGNGATSVSVNKPSAIQAGDVALAQIVLREASTSITPPTGWNLIRRDDTSSAMSSALYYKVATSSEPSSYTFSLSSSQQAVVGVAAYSGVDTTNPIGADSGRYNLTTATMIAPSVTTSAANDMLVWFGAVTSYSATITQPSGMTNEYAVNNGYSSGVSADMANQIFTSSGATGDKVGTNSIRWKSNIAQLVALKKAP